MLSRGRYSSLRFTSRPLWEAISRGGGQRYEFLGREMWKVEKLFVNACGRKSSETSLRKHYKLLEREVASLLRQALDGLWNVHAINWTNIEAEFGALKFDPTWKLWRISRITSLVAQCGTGVAYLCCSTARASTMHMMAVIIRSWECTSQIKINSDSGTAMLLCPMQRSKANITGLYMFQVTVLPVVHVCYKYIHTALRVVAR